MAAQAVLQKKTFTTVQEEVAHQRLTQNKWYPGGQPVAAIEGEDEVRFLGGDAYVPRLVAASVPIAKPSMPGVPTETSGYAEPLQAKRPVFLRGAGGGVAPQGAATLPTGGGTQKGAPKVKEQPKESQFPFNLLGGPGI
mmetsp:Transcript_58406/g.71420  ORF Transcript_58406/g.71420 Transcript_58406/m.71420 type:complete len:139 (+) Transcript_58406:51-467(+)